jgi:NAD(P)-dependent dehydrogenase (short-subunit alcohol dehydrogenase family)
MKNVAIITGASRGIGAATATHLAANGYAVCINYNSAADRAEQIVKEISAAGGKAIAVKADMSKESDIIRLFETVDQELGVLTALVNNAGINGGVSNVEDITAACLESVFATNVYGTFYACREAVKRMKPQNHGAIVNVSSEAAKFGGTQLAHYAASKAAINTFTVAFAREVAPHNIRVNTVSPGVIDTEIHSASSPERIANLMKTLPMKRMGSKQEVAELITWLLSSAASYVSGTIIPITGSR